MAALQFIYAGVNLLGKAALSQGMSPLVYLSYRLGIATFHWLPLHISLKGRSEKGNFWLIFLAALFGITLNQGSTSLDYGWDPPPWRRPCRNLVPAVTFLMAAPLGLEKAGLRSSRGIAKIAGTGVCVIGAATMPSSGALTPPSRLEDHGNLHLPVGGEDWYLGCLFLLGSICCWSIWLILQVFISRTYFHPLPLVSVDMFLLRLLAESVALTFIFEPDLKAWRLGSTIEIICCIYAPNSLEYSFKEVNCVVGSLGSGVTMFVQSWCISRRGALFSAMFHPFAWSSPPSCPHSSSMRSSTWEGTLVSSVVVVAGLYLVLWGKAEEYSTRKEESLQEDEHRVQHSAAADEGRKTGLEEPLLVDGVHHDIEKRAN
ncbi:unnamed protein product [Spirodela intermedia]|uniref:WAT1-related protein n=1 Tax=Spirodela intermedia TaxID=51605 RepID=A0ABN7EBV6_SPIIN|nr:unnamed protein product [Spirodela intermedia]